MLGTSARQRREMRKIVFLALNLMLALFLVIILLGVTMGVTGFSDKMLGSVINEEMRQMRTALAQTIRDPVELENTLKIKERELIALHGLDRPWYWRLPGDYKRIFTLNLGEAKTIRSFDGSSNISDIILDRLPNTLILMLTSFLIVFFAAVALGAKLAVKAGSGFDRAITALSAVSFATPAWWLGILLILVFGYYLNVLPAGGMYGIPPPEGTLPRLFDVFKHAILPILALVMVMLGGYLYSIRNVTLKIAQEDFVRYAKARGFSERRIILRYILRPAAPLILTGFAFGLIASISGSILTETVFKWPGMGLLYKEAVLGAPDEGLIIALTAIYTMFYVIARLVLEALYVWLDPRIRT